MNLNDKLKARIHLIYGIALSVILGVVGILFICSCYSIYKSGSSPFTRESIAEAFSRIAIPVYLAIAAVIGGGAICVAIPKEETKLQGQRTPSIVLKKLSARVDFEALDDETREGILKERKTRALLKQINIALITFVTICPLFYLLNPANFPAASGQYNAEILHGMLVYLAFLAPLAVYEAVYVVLSDRSCKRECELTKAAIKSFGSSIENGEDKDHDHDCIICRTVGFLKKNEKPIILGVRIALVGCAIVFIIAGITNGGMVDVLNKAIKICTECIGLG